MRTNSVIGKRVPRENHLCSTFGDGENSYYDKKLIKEQCMS